MKYFPPQVGQKRKINAQFQRPADATDGNGGIGTNAVKWYLITALGKKIGYFSAKIGRIEVLFSNVLE